MNKRSEEDLESILTIFHKNNQSITIPS